MSTYSRRCSSICMLPCCLDSLFSYNVFNINMHINLNRCVTVIGLPILSQHYQILKEYPVVSVGSGNGSVEKCLDPSDKIICVDPCPQSFQSEPTRYSHPPDYKIVKDLVNVKSDLIGECSIFLNWPSPSNPFLNTNPYDVEAIRLLKPKLILLVLERSGSSGSVELIGSLSKLIELENEKYITEDEKMFHCLDNYSVAYHTSCVDKVSDMGPYLYSYVLLKRKDVEINEVEEIPTEIFNDKFFRNHVIKMNNEGIKNSLSAFIHPQILDKLNTNGGMEEIMKNPEKYMESFISSMLSQTALTGRCGDTGVYEETKK